MTSLEPLLPIGAWAWSAYGKDAVAWLVNRFAKNAEDVNKAAWEKVEWHRASQAYRQKMSEVYGKMHIFGMGSPVALDNVYTDLYVLDTVSAQRRHTIEQLEQISTTGTYPIDEQRYDGISHVQQNKRLYMLGQPGAGKTTFLKYVVQQAVKSKINAVPIFVELRGWASANCDLMSFITRQFAVCSFPDAQPFVAKLLEDGKAIVLFDGLDEVLLEDEKRSRIVNTIRDFAHQYEKTQIIITCRTAADEYLFEGFTYCELAHFTAQQQRTFVSQWFRTAPAKGDAFWHAFGQDQNSGLRELSNRPLLLTMLCLTFDETMSFPLRRAELYQEAIDALLKRWDTSRSIKRDVIYQYLSHKRKVQLLAYLAAHYFLDGKQFMTKYSLEQELAIYWSRLPSDAQQDAFEAEVVIRAIEAQHGLIVERAHDVYSFSHLTFQEFLTAQYIAQHASGSRVLEGMLVHAGDHRWREVFLLTTSLLEYDQADHFFVLWIQLLEHHIADDEECTLLFLWIDEKCEQRGLHQSAHRVGLLSLMLLYYAKTQAAQLVKILEGVRYHDASRISDLELARIIDRDFSLALSIARASTGDYDILSALPRIDGIGLNQSRPLSFSTTRDSDLDSLLLRICSFARGLVNRGQHIYEQLPLNNQQTEWQHIYSLADELHEDGISFLQTAVLEVIDNYFSKIQLLLDCLDLASVSDREGIIQKLFLPPRAVTSSEQSLR